MDENKKIGIDVRLGSETGIGRYIRNLVECLIDLDHKNNYILFACSKDSKSIKDLISKTQNFQIITTDIKWHSVKEQIEFPRLLSKYNLDLVHFPYFSVPIFYNKPFVVTVHDLIINHFPTGMATTLPAPLYLAKRFGYSFVLKHAMSNSKKILVPTNATKQEILDHYPVSDSKIVVTPEGVDKTILDFKPTIFKEKRPFFLYVGNAYPHKNVEKLVEAFEIFLQKHPEFVLRFVGKKDYFLTRLTSQVKSPQIEFMGYVSDLDLAKLYKTCVATYIPSLMEGFGLTALEAMSVGGVVSCSRIPALEEVCGQAAYYFEPKDVLSIVASMETVASLSVSTRKEKIALGKKQVEKYSWEKMAKWTIDVYNSSM